MNKKIGILVVLIVLAVVLISGCIGNDTNNGLTTISFNGHSFEVPNSVSGGESVGGNNALLSIGNNSLDVGTNDTYGQSNLYENPYGEIIENRTVDNITYLYTSYHENEEFNQGHLITIQAYVTKDNTQYYVLVHTEEGQNITEIDNIIETIIKTIHPI